jgi:CubicO group peptidase (beta-lactamase class C family)
MGQHGVQMAPPARGQDSLTVVYPPRDVQTQGGYAACDHFRVQAKEQAGPHSAGSQVSHSDHAALEYLRDLSRRGEFSGTVLLAQRGRIVLRAAFGMADAGSQALNLPGTRFRIASLTKQFTAMAILQLQDEGRLTVADRICRYLSPCPPSWREVTIAQLLTHTSGIPDYTTFPGYPQWSRQPTTPDQIAALAAQRPLLFPPGRRWSYSNMGYVLLGMIVARASGLSYPDFLQRHVFAPLHMRDTGYDAGRQPSPGGATGYLGGYQPAPAIDMSVPYAAGGLYSTVDDLSRWDSALLTGRPRLVSPAALRQMFRPAVPVAPGYPEEGEYGYGWFIDLGGAEYDHDGLINGFAAENAIFPDARAQVIVLSNDQDSDVRTIAEHLAAAIGLRAR